MPVGTLSHMTTDDTDKVLCPITCGTNLELEEIADELLVRSRDGITKLSEKKDFLTPGQLERRRWREVYNRNGFPEPHLFSGLFRRVYNPQQADRKRGRVNRPDEY